MDVLDEWVLLMGASPPSTQVHTSSKCPRCRLDAVMMGFGRTKSAKRPPNRFSSCWMRRGSMVFPSTPPVNLLPLCFLPLDFLSAPHHHLVPRSSQQQPHRVWLVPVGAVWMVGMGVGREEGLHMERHRRHHRPLLQQQASVLSRL